MENQKQPIPNFKDDKLILNTISKILFPIIMLFAFYIHLHGDIRPGGGFQSGVILAIAFIIPSFLKNNNDLEPILKKETINMISFLGFLAYFLTGFLSLIKDLNFFNYKYLAILFPNQYNVLAIFIIEFGIMLVVFSSIIRIINTIISFLKSEDVIN